MSEINLNSPLALSPDSETLLYKGACHCRKFQFQFKHAEIKEVTECNCSNCTQRGALVRRYLPGDRFHFTSGSFDEMKYYQFNKRVVKQYFCPICGCMPFGTAADGKEIGINVRSLDNFDLKDIAIRLLNGASM